MDEHREVLVLIGQSRKLLRELFLAPARGGQPPYARLVLVRSMHSDEFSLPPTGVANHPYA